MNDNGERKCIFVNTPVIKTLNGKPNCKVFLKLENTQPSGSFKTRGISEHCRKLAKRGCRHFVSSSGGNAGLAVAYSGKQFQIPVTVFVPTTTTELVIKRINLNGAKVHVKGDVWDETNKYAIEFVKTKANEHAALVHPFDHEEIWEGHATMIHELKNQLPYQPSAIVVSVGGGGLLCGVLKGLHDVGWSDVQVVACETEGADCFNAAVKAGKPIQLKSITSIAKSLGALMVVPEALDWYKKHKILPVRVTDQEAIDACINFADDHKMLVEPACGAALTAMYTELLKENVIKGTLQNLESVVIIVCGGSSVDLKTMISWKKDLQSANS